MEGKGMGHHLESAEEKKKEWDAQGELLERFYASGEVVEPPENFADAFRPRDRVLRCIDERTPGGFALAGSGALLPRKDAVLIARDMGVEAVTSHEGCGAAKMAVERLNGPVHDDRIDAFARDWSRGMAEELGVPYAGHLKVSPAFHNARVAYYYDTGSFDWSRVKGLPVGFRVSRKYLPAEYAQSEISVAISIAAGSHGYGPMIGAGKDSSFILTAVGDGKSLPGLVDELKPLIGRWFGRVVIKTLRVP